MIVKRGIRKALPFLFLIAWMVFGCNGEAEKVTRGLNEDVLIELDEEDFQLIASDGIDERRKTGASCLCRCLSSPRQSSFYCGS